MVNLIDSVRQLRKFTPKRPEVLNRLIAEKQRARATITNTPSPNTTETNISSTNREQIEQIPTSITTIAQSSTHKIAPTPPIKPWHKYIQERQALRLQNQSNNDTIASTSITTTLINTNTTTQQITTHNIRTQTDINESIIDAICEAENDAIRIEADILRSLTLRDFNNNICPICNELVVNTLGRGLLGVDKIFWKDCYHDIPGDKVFILKKCSHLVFLRCIRMLTVMNKYNCPVCRKPFQDEDISKPH